MRRIRSKTWQTLFGFLLATVLILLPAFIAKVKVLRTGADSIVLEVRNVTPYSGIPSIAIIQSVVRNEGKVLFDKIEGELYIYRGDDILYSCYAVCTGRVPAGEERKVEFTVSNLYEAEPLLAYPAKEMSYSWTPVSAHFVGFGFLFTQPFGPDRSVPWLVIIWLAAAAGVIAAGILAVKARRREEEEALTESHTESGPYSYGYSGTGVGTAYGACACGSSGGGGAYSASPAAEAGSPGAGASAVDRDALESAQRSLERAGWMGASYRSQGLTQDAERQEHFKRSAFGEVLRESAGLSGRDRDAFESARKSYEQASRFEASYRAGGPAQQQNAEHAQYRRESAYAGMLKAVAEKDGRSSSDFNSAKNSYERESLLASSYRASGSKENAAEAEHRMRLAYGNMLKNTSDLDREAYRDFSDAQRSYESASRSAASYRRQGMTRDAERAEHHMRLAEANMLKVKAEAKGNGREFDDARRDYENASRRYSEYKSSGREADANREKDYMDRAYAKMMRNL